MTTGYVLDRWVELSQTFVRDEVLELQRQGERVAVLALHRGNGADVDIPATHLRDSPSGRTHLREHARWAVRRPLGYARFLLAVRRQRADAREIAWRRLPWAATRLQEQGVDRLHAHFAWAGAAAADALSSLTGWPWALTVHARDLYVPKPGAQQKVARATRLVTVCRYNETYLRERYGVTREVAQVVCGVTAPEPWTRPEPTTDVVGVGRLVEKKGFDVLLRAVALLERDDLRVVVVGEGPERPRLEQLLDELELRGVVTLAGALPHGEVLDLVGRSKALALPARVAPDGDADATPVVVKEAMVREVPVVVTPVSGLPELVDGDVGAVVAPDDPAALAAALTELLSDDGLRERLGKAGRARAQERADLATEVARLRALHRSMA